jgi:putative transposase
MRKRVRKTKDSQERNSSGEPIQLSLAEAMRNNLHIVVVSAGIEVLSEMLEEERTAICGLRYRHNQDREASRAGHAAGELVMGGRRVTVRRPRARSVDNKEVLLPSWERFSDEDPLHDRAVEQMVVGVPTRKYGRSLEQVPEELKSHGTSKSAVSRRFVAATEKKFKAWMTRDLSGLDLCVLMIDGVSFTDHMILVGLGIDTVGKKHVLGLWEGATENASACKALLSNLRDRGLRTEQSILAVIDGSKALVSALRSVFGRRVLIQRCRVHKKRNVREHLGPELHDSIMLAMSEAYGTGDVNRAEKLLKNLARRIKKEHPGASASLTEGLEETLTVKKLGLSGELERILCTTNAVENLIGSGRNFTRRVKRWRGGSMVLRWMATAMQEAQTKFRRIKGYRDLPKLVAALAANDRLIDGVDKVREVA